jgi:SAM-dependent methyltransferase
VAARNVNERTVAGFGREWSAFDQTPVPPAELDAIFERYFALFPWGDLPHDAVGFDLGCGSGRWAARVAPRVGELHCVDASAEALEVARRNLAGNANCRFHCASVDALPLAPASMDFGYAIGVLHHVPDPAAGLRACVERLKPGAPFLVYLYYAFDNRPPWYRALWRGSDLVRRGVSHAPHPAKLAFATAVAAGVYWPLGRLAGALERAGVDPEPVPLAYYRKHSLYTMRTDAYDRFGTPLEHRFTRAGMEAAMRAAGLTDVTFSESPPYWCALGYAASRPRESSSS